MTGPALCPDQETLAALLRGTLSPEHEEQVTRHLEGCAACEARVQHLEAQADPLVEALRQASQKTRPVARASTEPLLAAAGTERSGGAAALPVSARTAPAPFPHPDIVQGQFDAHTTWWRLPHRRRGDNLPDARAGIRPTPEVGLRRGRPVTNSQGQASVPVQANGKYGSYSVSAALATLPQVGVASFALTNLYVTTTTVKASSTSPVFGEVVTLTATVGIAASSASPPGAVTFWNGDAALGTAALSRGQAVLKINGLDLGANVITATYGGSSAYAASTALPQTVTVGQAASKTQLTASTAASARPR